jgi:D-inositol-3-phosphate glycosyltransferase
MMRQLHVIPYYDPAVEFGGVQTVCRHLVDAMVQRGHAVTVLTTDVASRRARLPSLRERVRGADVVRLPNLSQRLVASNLYTPRHVSRALDELLPRHDLVHVHDVFNWLTVRTSSAVERHRVPSVLSTDGLFSFRRERGRARTRALLFRAIGRRVVSRFDRVHAVRQGEIDAEALGIAAERVRYIANGVVWPPQRTGDGARFRQRWGLGDRVVVLFVGQLLPMKGLDLMLALARERLHDQELYFVFAGQRPDGPPAVAGTWSARNVLYVGFLTGQDLADAYAGASIYALPSYFDVMPNTALDALAHGVPSLVTRQILLPEVGEGAGVLIEPTLASLRDGLDRMLAQRAAWPRMAERARALVAERLALSRIHDQYEAMYAELVRG